MGHTPAHFPPQPSHPTRSLLFLLLPPRARLSAPASPLAHALSPLPFSLCQAGPARQHPFSLPLSSPAQRAPKLQASSLASGPHANVGCCPTRREPPRPRTLNLAAAAPLETRSAAASFFPPPRRRLGLTVDRPFRCTPDHHITRKSFPLPSRSSTSPASKPYASASTEFPEGTFDGEPLHRRNSSSSLHPDPS
jgi:hypothetical protein